jgi:hypothetical protein
MTKNYLIALDPAVGLTPQEFMAAWQESEEARDLGQLTPDSGPPAAFVPPEVVDGAVLLLQTAVAIAGGVLANQISDLLKKKHARQNVKVITIDPGDGRPIIVITVES